MIAIIMAINIIGTNARNEFPTASGTCLGKQIVIRYLTHMRYISTAIVEPKIAKVTMQ
uniref:Uncharacterized protein n=2 Tax=Spiroplasma citri TaxID=2133 RepID=Q14KE4_SPICI|nr:hypothetical protein SPICINP13_011 [Spiroplasma citri]